MWRELEYEHEDEAEFRRVLRPDSDRNRLCATGQYLTIDFATAQDDYLYLRNDVCNGQSGSPVWLSLHPTMGGRVLIGVMVKESLDMSSNMPERITPDVLQWIRDNTI